MEVRRSPDPDEHEPFAAVVARRSRREQLQRAAVDRELDSILIRASDGLEYGTAANAITQLVQAIEKQAAALNAKGYEDLDQDRTARALSHAMKGLNELYRLLQFAKGAPDSRPDLGGDWLRGLTTEQLAQVQRWVEENARVDKA